MSVTIKEGFKNSILITIFSFILILIMHMQESVPFLQRIMNY